MLTTVILPFAYEGLLERLHQHNIEARPLWKPMHLQPLFQNNRSMTSPMTPEATLPKSIASKAIDGTSERLFTHGLCLPSGSALTAQDVAYICKPSKPCSKRASPNVFYQAIIFDSIQAFINSVRLQKEGHLFCAL